MNVCLGDAKPNLHKNLINGFSLLQALQGYTVKDIIQDWRVDWQMSTDNKENNNNSLINLSLSTVIVFAGIIIFMWFAFQTLFQIIFYQILDHCGILPENNNIVNQSRRN